MAKESQSKERMDQCTHSGHGPVLAETSTEYGEEGRDEKNVELQEPTPPSVNLTQSRGRKFKKLLPVIK
jgi:hypothetical protein